MRERLRVFFNLAIFWLSFMILARVAFLGYNHDLSAHLTFGEMLLAMLHGLPMDISLCGYFLALSGLLLTFSALIPGRWIYFTLTTITLVLLFASSVIVMADLELYRHWGFRMNTTPIFYIIHTPAEAMGSIVPSVLVNLTILFIIMFSLFTWLYFRFIAWRVKQLTTAKRKASLVLFTVSALMFIPIRGSFSVAPMNTGFVYFHNAKPYANHTAINVIWNFLYTLRKSNNSYPENFFDKTQTQKLFASLYPASDSTLHVFKVTKPNVILIILESFTADVIEPLGGIEGIAPNLNKLCREGILFENFYASGDRTDKGLISILSGYPAQPQTSIVKFPAKSQQLPHLNLHLKRLGYRSSFIYGGDVDFANFRSYLNTGGFDHITTVDDFDDSLNESKWGVHDHFMLNKAMAELDTTTGTFFKVILTLSSHEPFDVPMATQIPGMDEESLFLNSCYYTDKSIGDFITQCKQKTWWENTVVVITADHGHRHPRKKELIDKERFKIPLLMIGGAIQKDTVISTFGNQTDICNTLLAQLDKPYREFTFSKDMLSNTAVPFTAYFFNDGYGFLMPGKYIVYDNPGKQFLKQDGATQEDLNVSKAYQQTLYSDYNRK